MPPLRENPSADTLRKRASRARLKAADPDGYLAQQAAQARSWRAAVKARKEADAVVIPDDVDRPDYIAKVNTLRTDLNTSIAKIVSIRFLQTRAQNGY